MRDRVSFLARTAGLVAVLMASGIAVFGDGPHRDELTAELRATEEAFARTMADRDHEAFTSFLADDAVFFGSRGEIRGRKAVTAAWKPFYEGRDAPFSWQPDTVAVLDSGTLGLTSGPVFAPDGTRIGTFNSVWRRLDGGTWQVVFDRGCPPCECPPAAPTD